MSDTSGEASTRAQTHGRLSAALARLDDRELQELIVGLGGDGRGWAIHGTVEFEGSPVFVKCVPLTRTEAERPSSTENLFGMPTYYNYGVGSAGFGVGRELAGHIATTDFVLKGAPGGFPLMYHHRVLPAGSNEDSRWDDKGREAYLRYWGGDQRISRYMRERDEAKSQVVIVLEHHPHTLAPWLVDHPDSIDEVVNQLLETIEFLRANGVVHFDAHFNNVVTDGSRHYLTDYGLVLDERFDLDAEERAFLDRHRDYDFAEVLLSAGNQLAWHVGRRAPEEFQAVKRAFGIEGDRRELWRYSRQFIERADELAGLMPVDTALLACVKRYGPVMRFMSAFFGNLRANPRKDTVFDHEELRKLLDDAGVRA